MIDETSPPEQPTLVNALDMHLPVLSVTRLSTGAVSSAKAYVYGTAFPIAKGLFATAGHVLDAALSDGTPCLSRFVGGGGQLPAHIATRWERFPEIDFALIECPELAWIPRVPVAFADVNFWDPAFALGFPFAADAEWVSVVPRGFRGYVVTRRKLAHLPAQPPGIELSFPTPRGLSGSPLMIGQGGQLTCAGHVIQQSTLGTGDDILHVGLGVDAQAWLWLKSQMLGRPVAEVFGREYVPPPPVTTPPLPGGLTATTGLESGWPDDPPAGNPQNPPPPSKK